MQGAALPLSDPTIRTAKPKDKLYRLTDANGLCLEVAPSGSKLWRYCYRFNGSAKMLALGAYPAITLLKARQMRDESRQLLVDGIDSGEQKKASRQAQKVEGVTFETLAREWFAYNAPRWADSRLRHTAREPNQAFYHQTCQGVDVPMITVLPDHCFS